MDLNQLYTALNQIQPPGTSQADIYAMMDQAQAMQNAALNRRSVPFTPGNSGAGAAAAQFLRNRTSDMYEKQGMDALKQAYGAQAGLDEYNAQIAQLQGMIEELRERQSKREDFDYEEKVRHQNRMERDAARGPNRTYNISPPTGYTFADPNNPEAGFKVIPGSPQEQAMKEAEAKDQARERTVASRADNVLTEIDKAISLIGPTTAGWGGMLKDLPQSDARALSNAIKPIQANLAFDRLQAMRNESKTGGALGQVSNIELDLLKSTVGSLDQLNKPEELQRVLEKIREHYAAFTASLDGKVPANYQSGEVNGKKYVKIGDQWHEL